MPLPAWSTDLIGVVAGTCTTVAFVPQLVRVWRLKTAEEISRTTFLVFSVGTFIWLVYGLIIGSLPVILANGVTFVLAVTLLSLKVGYDRTPRAPPTTHPG